MIQKIKNLLGIGPKVNLGELIASGATILDVRTRSEFSSGHAKGSINVPLDQLSSFSKKIKEATNGTTDLIRTHEKEIAVITAN